MTSNHHKRTNIFHSKKDHKKRVHRSPDLNDDVKMPIQYFISEIIDKVEKPKYLKAFDLQWGNTYETKKVMVETALLLGGGSFEPFGYVFWHELTVPQLFKL